MPFCFSKVPLYFFPAGESLVALRPENEKKTVVSYCIMGSIHLQRAYPPNSSHR